MMPNISDTESNAGSSSATAQSCTAEMLVRRIETIECPNCGGSGRDSVPKYHNDVEWFDCKDCDGEGEVEEYIYYWVDSLPPHEDELDKMDGRRHSLFW